MTLSKQIDKWYQAGEHGETVKAILNLTEGDVTDSLTEDLAVAYNNLGQYEKAIETLKGMDSQNRSSPHWHYCMGYALYYASMDSPTHEKQQSLLQGAFASFSQALRLNPKKGLETECREFLSWISDDLCSFGSAEKAAPQEGAFVCSVLLSGAWFDKDKFLCDFYTDWSLPIIPDDSTDSNAISSVSPSLVFSADNMTASITLVPFAVPRHEAEKAASCNYLWPNAHKVTQKHKAHLLITVLDIDAPPIDKGILLVKIASTCCLQLPAMGVFTGGTVYQIGLYRNMAAVIKSGQLPVFNWVWFGLYRTSGGIGGYTYGLELFGRDEIEVPNSDASPDRLRNFLVDLVFCVLESHAVFQDGDTVGLSPGQRLPVTRSKGLVLPGMTLKIPCHESLRPDSVQESSPVYS